MPTKNDEKKAQERQDKVLAEGRFAVDAEEGDNAVDLGNEDYIGTDPIYQNSAYDTHKPLPTDASDDEATAAIEERAKASNEALTNLDVNRSGHTVGPHRAGQGTSLDDEAAEAPQDGDDGDDGAAAPSSPQG